jgi:hypothetical protein
VWLFGSGLIGLIEIARRKKSITSYNPINSGSLRVAVFVCVNGKFWLEVRI